MLEPIDEKPLLCTVLPACDCIVRSAEIRVRGDSHVLFLRLKLRGLPRMETIIARDLADLTERLIVDLGFELHDARQIVNRAAGGN